MAARGEGATQREPKQSAVDLESVLLAGEESQAGQVDRADLVPTRGGENARSAVQSESATKRAVRSLVDTEALR